MNAALAAGEESSTEQCGIKIKLVAPPLHVVTTACLQNDSGISALNTALGAVESEIVKRRGNHVLKEAPITVSEKDEKTLSSMMAALQVHLYRLSIVLFKLESYEDVWV